MRPSYVRRMGIKGQTQVRDVSLVEKGTCQKKGLAYLFLGASIYLFLGVVILPLDFEIQHWREKVYLG
jgi:hypothetical protein